MAKDKDIREELAEKYGITDEAVLCSILMIIRNGRRHLALR